MAKNRDSNKEKTVLLIDNQIDAGEALHRLLESYGYHAVWRQDSQAGLNEAMLSHPDCVIVNLELPGLDGFDIARLLRTLPEFRSKPLVGLCSFPDSSYHQLALDAGFSRYFCKPLAFEVLNAYLQGVARS
jgi:DNA-binding response OmpR family regulator